MNEEKIYNVWKATSKGDPIEGTDRVYKGRTKRSIIRHLAIEEGVEYYHNDMIVRCKDGTIWCVFNADNKL